MDGRAGRAGAEPLTGRKLPGWLAGAGFHVQVDLLDRLTPPSPLRFELLRGLPLDVAEQAALQCAEAAGAALDSRLLVVHLPMFLVTAEKRYPSTDCRKYDVAIAGS